MSVVKKLNFNDLSKKKENAEYYDRSGLILKLEEDVWSVLHHISSTQNTKINELIRFINFMRKDEVTIENACRVFVISYLLGKCDDIDRLSFKKEKSKFIPEKNIRSPNLNRKEK